MKTKYLLTFITVLATVSLTGTAVAQGYPRGQVEGRMELNTSEDGHVAKRDTVRGLRKEVVLAMMRDRSGVEKSEIRRNYKNREQSPPLERVCNCASEITKHSKSINDRDDRMRQTKQSYDKNLMRSNRYGSQSTAAGAHKKRSVRYHHQEPSTQN